MISPDDLIACCTRSLAAFVSASRWLDYAQCALCCWLGYRALTASDGARQNCSCMYCVCSVCSAAVAPLAIPTCQNGRVNFPRAGGRGSEASQSFSVSEGVKNLERWLTRDSQGITKLLMKVGQLRYNRMTSAVPGFCDVESVMCCGGFAGTSSVRHILYHTMVTTAHRCRAS